MLVNFVGLLIEVTANAARISVTNLRLVKAAKLLHKETSLGKNPILEEFIAKVEASWYISPIYAAIMLSSGALFLGTYIKYDSSVPYAYAMFAFTIITWPILGLRPIFRLRSRFGKQIDRSKETLNSNTNAIADNLNQQTIKDGTPVHNSEISMMRHSQTKQSEMIAHQASFSSNGVDGNRQEVETFSSSQHSSTVAPVKYSSV